MRNQRIPTRILSCVLLSLALTLHARTVPNAENRDLPDLSRLGGGLVVHIGCGQGEHTAFLRATDRTVVQGLDTDQEKIRLAKERILSSGLSGTVSFDVFDGQTLPYVDNLANVAVVEENSDVKLSELFRVLRPGGTAYLRQRGKWKIKTKSWPKEMDEWTHYLHDPQGTSVSRDQWAGHPKGLRWTGGPLWARSHEHTASLQAMVGADGKVFYVMDEGPIHSIQLPPKMMLTARDAFNGIVLWKRPLHAWWNPLYPLKSGPGWLPRRLVAVGDKVYLAQGVGENLLCLDAATGEPAREFQNTASTFELIVSQGVVFAAVDSDRRPCEYKQEHANCWKERDRASKRWGWHREQGHRVVKAMDADTGDLLWEREMPVAPMTLCADDDRVCLYDGDAVVAMDRATGEEQWKADTSDLQHIPTGYGGPRLVLCGDKVLFSPLGEMAAIDSKTGDILWRVEEKPKSGHFSLEDLYVIDGKIWVLKQNNNGTFSVYDLETGELLHDVVNPIDSFYIHQRCYPGRATERLLLPPIMGTTVYDIKNDAWSINHWVRGGCIYGSMPAYGMVYATPHACACYYQSKLNGFNAVAPEGRSPEAPPAEQRLEKGPAYASGPKEEPAEDWPTFRHDNTRSGFVKTDVTAEVREAWKRSLGAKLSQPVVCREKVFVSEVDHHTVHALDAASGKTLWTFLAGGRVDSPPTVHKGRVLFGCADGRVYALDEETGDVAWTFQAAPDDSKLMSYGQLESVWPLSGSVLVQDDKLYCVAGRSMFLDGGLRMIILDPATGELLSENVMDRLVPGSDQCLDDLLMGKHLPVAMPDILSSDGQYVYMKSQTFRMDGTRVRVEPQRPDTQYDQEVHLFSPISFLDDTWHQRTYWIYGRAAGEGWAEFQLPPKRVPCGRILCLDEENAYGFGRDPELMCNTSVTEYRLYSAKKEPARKVGIPKLEGQWVEGQYPADEPLAAHTVDWKKLSEEPKERLSALDYRWILEEPTILARSMVLANDRLFVAGPKDVADEKSFWGRSNEGAFQEKMSQQVEWLEGKHGAFLQVFSKKDGEKLAEQKLPYLPVFDGLIAARGKLFMSTVDGSLVCLEGT